MNLTNDWGHLFVSIAAKALGTYDDDDAKGTKVTHGLASKDDIFVTRGMPHTAYLALAQQTPRQQSVSYW